MKSGNKLGLLLIMLFFTSVVFTQEPSWLVKMKSIKLLVSTRNDIITIFGEPIEKEKMSYGKYYDLEDGRMHVGYATGLCVTKTEDGIKKMYGWNVPEWTVTDLSFYPDKGISPEKLNVKFTGFQKSEIEDVLGAIIYENKKKGISYTVYAGKITEIFFYPAKQNNDLLCK